MLKISSYTKLFTPSIINQKLSYISKFGISEVKVCSIVLPGLWRDNLVVPPNFSTAECTAFASSMGALSTERVCLFEDGSFSILDRGGNRNCGW